MRYRRGVQKLREFAGLCQDAVREEPLLREAYVFGELLDGADPLDRVGSRSWWICRRRRGSHGRGR